MTRPLKVIHLPTAVGGHPGTLARAERELGLDSRAVSLLRPPFGLPVDEVLGEADDHRAKRYLDRARLLRKAAAADVVHFNFGEPILPDPGGTHGAVATVARAVAFRDLQLLHRLGRRIVVTFQGDDARQAVVGGLLVEAVPEHYTAELDAARRRTIAAFDRHAHAIFYLNPDLAQVLPARACFLPYASVDPREWTVSPEAADGPPIVVHAPSDKRVKGTDHIVAAVEQLRAEGVPLRFELVHGVGREAVRAATARAAVVVDQLFAGWYGGFAVEAMALGKPVVASLAGLTLPGVPPGLRDDLPIVHVAPETLADRLRTLLLSADERRRIGLAGRAFVDRWHDPRAVARTVIEAYRAEAGGHA